jgi:hypothetical protein
MDNANLLLLATTALFWYATGASWLLQYVAYPTYKLINKADFAPFHSAFGKRLRIVTVMPMLLGNVLSFVLVLFHPESSPVGLVYVVAICAIIILFTTIKYTIPRHKKLDTIGKNDDLIEGLVKDNSSHTISWTVASIALSYMILQAF